MEFDIEDLHVTPSSSCKFHKFRYNGSHNLLKGVNEIYIQNYLRLRPILITLNPGDVHKNLYIEYIMGSSPFRSDARSPDQNLLKDWKFRENRRSGKCILA